MSEEVIEEPTFVLGGPIKTEYDKRGGLATFGEPVTDVVKQGSYTGQWFDKGFIVHDGKKARYHTDKHPYEFVALHNARPAYGIKGLWRTADPDDQSAFDVFVMATMLKTQIIIRLNTYKDKAIKGIKNIFCPIDPPGDKKEVYVAFVKVEKWRLEFGKGWIALANCLGTADVHCTVGKDRTGWFVWVLQKLLRIPKEARMADYLESNKHLFGGHSKVSESYILAAHNALLAKYQKVGMTERAAYVAYVKDCGLTDKHIDKLMTRLVDGVATL